MSFDAITTRHMLWIFSGVKGHNVIRGVKGIQHMPMEISVKLGAIIPKLFFSLLSPLIFLF